MSKKEKKKVKSNPKGTKVSKEFMFKLTESESNEKGKNAAALRQEVKDLELQFEEVKETWKAKIKTREAKRDELLDVVHAQEEKRIVDSILVKDFESKEIQYWFEGEIVEKRTMTANEMQGDLPLQDAAKAKAVRQKIEKQDPIAAAQADGDRTEIAEVHKLETSRHTKNSAVDGPRQ